MDGGKSVVEIDDKLQLTRLRPLPAEWLAELCNQMTTKEGKDIIMSSWKLAGISQAIRTGSANLVSLDPFIDIDPFISEVTHENNVNIAKINDEEREVFVNPAIFMKTKKTVMKIFDHGKVIMVTFSIFLKTLNIRCHEKYS